ncbi:TPA: zinc ribbon domain-containing protein [Raoultella terrigena]|uniref:Zinc ribbon domain-containing protein n=1 Tax=Raoultella terrigena TaxID=577 RepID=A0AAQ0BNQ3_RAOTE|nr:zinc ribbon domain-containing protein [Raoultella terrigena]QPF10014.1 zinc ribbon domain-containing protein [Raoultella terrigena]
MKLACPLCHTPLELQGGRAHCGRCEQDFAVEARCPDCHRPLEVLKACGAIDYFCQHGHGLISKKRVEFVLPDQA